jgi:hypothetical protein
MRHLSLLLILLTGCANHIVKDPFPPSIDTGNKRVETIICGSHEVGENGCVFPDGNTSGSLRVLKVLSGEITLKGCGLDKSYSYSSDDLNQWLEVPLSGNLLSDCVIDVYQKVKFPGQDKLEFPIYGMRGTVSLGRCPTGVSCDFSSSQVANGVGFVDYVISGNGNYLSRGCGQVVDGPSPINGSKQLRFALMWPGGYPSGKAECLFVTGINGLNVQKRYFKVNIFRKDTVLLSTPEIKTNGNFIEFTGDEYASVTIVDGKPIIDHKGRFEKSTDGNYLRFYTVNGRSLIVFIKNGEIAWIK